MEITLKNIKKMKLVRMAKTFLKTGTLVINPKARDTGTIIYQIQDLEDKALGLTPLSTYGDPDTYFKDVTYILSLFIRFFPESDCEFSETYDKIFDNLAFNIDSENEASLLDWLKINNLSDYFADQVFTPEVLEEYNTNELRMKLFKKEMTMSITHRIVMLLEKVSSSQSMVQRFMDSVAEQDK